MYLFGALSAITEVPSTFIIFDSSLQLKSAKFHNTDQKIDDGSAAIQVRGLNIYF